VSTKLSTVVVAEEAFAPEDPTLCAVLATELSAAPSILALGARLPALQS